MKASNIQLIDMRARMADRESVSHLPQVTWEYVVPGYMFPGIRYQVSAALAAGEPRLAIAGIYDLAYAAVEFDSYPT